MDCSDALQSWFNLFPSSAAGAVAGGASGSGSGVARVAWSSSRPSVFFAGDAQGRLVAFDLLKSSQKPLANVQLPMAGSEAAAGSGALPTPFDAPTSAQSQRALMALSAAVPGAAPQQLSQSMLAFPAAVSSGQQQQQPTVEVHLLKPNFSVANDQERQQFAEYLQHVHAL